jgi:hypothetical protein
MHVNGRRKAQGARLKGDQMKRQQSSIDRLPPDILEKFQELLRDPRVTQLQATAAINAILEADGHPDRLSKSAVNRYAVKMDKVGEKLRQSREVAKMWIGRLGAEPQGEVGKLLNEMVRNLAFEVTMKLSEGDELAEPAMLKNLAIAVERLERAAQQNMKVEEEARKHERERLKDETLKAIDKAETQNGGRPMTAEDFRKAIKDAYGV